MTFQNPFAAAAFRTGKGIGQGLSVRPFLEERAINMLLEGGNIPTTEDVLAADLSPKRQQEIIKSLQEDERLRATTQQTQLKGLKEARDAEQKERERVVGLEEFQLDRERRGLPRLDPKTTLEVAKSLNIPPQFEKKDFQERVKLNFANLAKEQKAVDFAKKATVSVNAIGALTAENTGVFDTVKSVLRFFGQDVPENASEAIIRKANVDLWSGLRDAVGAIRFKTEFSEYLKSLPDLLKLPETRIALAKSMEKAFNLTIKRDEIRQEILRTTDGIPEFDLEENVDRIFEERFAGEAQQSADELDALLRPKEKKQRTSRSRKTGKQKDKQKEDHPGQNELRGIFE